MDNTWFLAALWVGLALVATLLAIWLRVSTALSEIVVGTVAQLIIGAVVGRRCLGAQTPWVDVPLRDRGDRADVPRRAPSSTRRSSA